jgi:hypothetical protein
MKFGYVGLCWMLVACLFTALVGCGEDNLSKGFKKANEFNIQKIANAYRMFASVNKNVGPKDESEFKAFFSTREEIPKRLGLSKSDLEDLDQYFISDADGEPFVILYGQRIKPDLDYSALVFDKTGADGVRRIALACSEVIEVSDNKQYDRILAGKIKRSDVPAHVFGGGGGQISEETENEVVQ